MKLELTPLVSGDLVIAGLSGGADSAAMTHYLRFHSEAEISVVACHLNHLLRGEESERDQQFVEGLCREWGIPLYLKRVKVADLAAESQQTLEQAGRTARYAFFEQVADQIQQNWKGRVYIATAHTLSDNLETVLFHLARGTGLRGLCGIPQVRGRIIRPLLDVSRQEIEYYCKTYQVPFVQDSTNFQTEYARNKIRLQAVPALKAVNQNLEGNVKRLLSLLKEDQDYLSWLAEQKYAFCQERDGLNIQKLLLQPPAIRHRIEMLLLEHVGLTPAHKIIMEMDAMAESGHGKQNLTADWYLEAKAGILHLKRAEALCEYYEYPLKYGNYLSKSGKNYKIKNLSITSSGSFHKVYKNLFDIWIDCGKIFGSVRIRQRRDGDRIRLLSQQHTKSLKKLFQERRISPEERSRLFVLADDRGVIALEGFGVDQRVCCDKTTTEIIAVTAEERT